MMTTSISSEARRNQTSILIRGRENHISSYTWLTDIRTDISIYRVASLLKRKIRTLFLSCQKAYKSFFSKLKWNLRRITFIRFKWISLFLGNFEEMISIPKKDLLDNNDLKLWTKYGQFKNIKVIYNTSGDGL